MAEEAHSPNETSLWSGHGDTEHLTSSRRHRGQSSQRSEEARLAGAIAAEHRGDRSTRRGEVHTGEDGEPAVEGHHLDHIDGFHALQPTRHLHAPSSQLVVSEVRCSHDKSEENFDDSHPT